ncbi:MAG: DUF4912 domain-containing protein [Elusimicrobiales bacterium]|nr:DUF4912 domain-containing protein [Elusimicrobiales bacterium]
MEDKDIRIPHENKLGLMPVRPGVFFALWDFSNVRVSRIREGEFSENIKLRLYNEKQKICFEGNFPWNSYGAYLEHEPRAGKYYAVLYVEGEDGWITLSESNMSLSPALSGTVNERSHASLEFHKKKVGT